MRHDRTRFAAAAVTAAAALWGLGQVGAGATGKPTGPFVKTTHVAFEGCPARNILLKATLLSLTYGMNQPILVGITIRNQSGTTCGHNSGSRANAQSGLGLEIGPCGNVSLKVENAQNQEVFPGPNDAPSCAAAFSVRLPAHRSLTTASVWSQQQGLNGQTQVPRGSYRILVDGKITFTVALTGPSVTTTPLPLPAPPAQGPCNSVYRLIDVAPTTTTTTTNPHQHCPIGQITPRRAPTRRPRRCLPPPPRRRPVRPTHPIPPGRRIVSNRIMEPDQRAQSLSVAERLGATVYDLVVDEVSNLTPSMRRIGLAAEGLAGLDPLPGQDMMLSVSTDDGSFVRRRYSIRSFDPVAQRVVLDVIVHGDGPGARWADAAALGDLVEAIGPRGKVTVDPDAAWHLFIGDESFTPAIFSMTEALDAETPAVVVIEVGGSDDELPLDAVACADGPHWLHRQSSPGVPSEVLLGELHRLALPAGVGHAYVGGEFHSVQALRALLIERGLDKDAISAKAYWRAGSSNASHGEPPKD